ncbi:hypothetical protein EVAR_9456_1 [Eumeta japonica]|uniref:Uncharacterized protein n=1 Tax=Eumeta variegata TaxID=151549 RepID=A0A4C1UDA5_EUMVA|nr:hypothetical protein EVAR_9456_1 [Eumeta japonica]
MKSVQVLAVYRDHPLTVITPPICLWTRYRPHEKLQRPLWGGNAPVDRRFSSSMVNVCRAFVVTGKAVPLSAIASADYNVDIISFTVKNAVTLASLTTAFAGFGFIDNSDVCLAHKFQCRL